MKEKDITYHAGYQIGYFVLTIYKGFLYGLGIYLSLKFCGVDL